MPALSDPELWPFSPSPPETRQTQSGCFAKNASSGAKRERLRLEAGAQVEQQREGDLRRGEGAEERLQRQARLGEVVGLRVAAGEVRHAVRR